MLSEIKTAIPFFISHETLQWNIANIPMNIINTTRYARNSVLWISIAM